MVGTVGALVLILLVLVVILLFIVPIFGGQLDVLGIFVKSNNIQPISSECELACLDGNKNLFCFNLTSKTLRLGDGRSIKGSCEAISNIGSIGVFDGISGCSKFSCGEGVKEAVCSKGWTNYDCKKWLTADELKKVEDEKAAELKRLEKERIEKERVDAELEKWDRV